MNQVSGLPHYKMVGLPGACEPGLRVAKRQGRVDYRHIFGRSEGGITIAVPRAQQA